jgi:hypothetical protein
MVHHRIDPTAKLVGQRRPAIDPEPAHPPPIGQRHHAAPRPVRHVPITSEEVHVTGRGVVERRIDDVEHGSSWRDGAIGAIRRDRTGQER